MVYACGPEPMLEAVAHVAARYGRRSQVSVERVMGCGLGGCYSCVIPVRNGPGGQHTSDRVSRGRSFRARRSCGTSMTLSVKIGSLTLANPLIAASGCFGYGVEYAGVVDLSLLGGVAVKGLFLTERQGHPPERIVETPAGMLNAIGLQGIGVHRFIREKLPELRERRRDGYRQHLRIDARRVRGAREDTVRRRRCRSARAEYFVSQHQGRRHHVRLQPARNVRRRERRAERSRAFR